MARAGGMAFAARAGRMLGRWTRGFMSKKRSGSSFSRSVKKRSRTSRRGKSVSKGHVSIDGSGGSHSVCKRIHCRRTPRIGGVQRVLTKDVYSLNDTLRITAGASFQSVNDVVLNHCNDLTAMALLINSSSVPGYKTTKYILHSAYKEIKLSNMDKGNVQVTLYDLVPKRDLSNNQYDPITSWTNGLADCVNNGSTTPAISNLGSTPFDSPRFCQNWTVKKSTKITLAQGQCHTHRIYLKVNRVINRELTQDQFHLRGLTAHTLIVANGLPLNDQTTKTNISTGAVVIDMISMTRYVYQGIALNPSAYSFSDAQVAPATAYLLDPGSGEPEADAAA